MSFHDGRITRVNGFAMADPAEARSEAARRLIEDSATEAVELVTVSALDLCALDGPRHVLFDEQVARAWSELPDAPRDAAGRAALEGLANRGLLIPGSGAQPGPAGTAGPGDPDTYALKPELGLVLAAKTRPTFAVLAQIERTNARTIKLYALGDESQPLQALVVELPVPTPPGDYPHVRRLGVLGWFYRYILVSPNAAANLLAGWAIKPPPKGSRGHRDPVRVVSVFWHRAGEALRGLVVTVRGDGRTARLVRDDQPDPGLVYDEAGLRQVMADLLTLGKR